MGTGRDRGQPWGAGRRRPLHSLSDGLKRDREGAVATVTIAHPERRNALSDGVLAALADRLCELDEDVDTRCIVISGGERVFASGADIGELAATPPTEAYDGVRFAAWERVRRLRTPLVAAVAGYCLGGGCELAMTADVIVAADTATFGLPETALGLLPGGGGTQWLPRAIGKAKAMDVILTGRRLTAAEAELAGLVSRVVPADVLMAAALEVAAEIAERPAIGQRLAKQAVTTAFETAPQVGLRAERAAFAAALASADAREGLQAFLDKRQPRWPSRRGPG